MKNLSQMQKTIRKSWLVVGMVFSLALIGVGGCGAKATTSSPAASSTQSSSTSTDASSTQSSSTSNQQTQGQAEQKPTPNPAIEAAMGIRRLQDNQQTVLTSEQKDKIKPILQTLIDTSSPSQDFFQQKADAIKAVFTDQQKTYLSTNTPKGNPNGKSQNGQEQPKDQNGAPNGNQAAPSGQSQDIFKQVLASLT